jgi:hypothetical protein
MRTMSELDVETQTRLRMYIESWKDVLSVNELATDLFLEPRSVTAVKANITRSTKKSRKRTR